MVKLFLCILSISLFSCNDKVDKNFQHDAQKTDSLQKEIIRLKEIILQAEPAREKVHEITPQYVYSVMTYYKEELVPEIVHDIPQQQSPIISSDLSVTPAATERAILPSHFVSIKKLWFSPIKPYMIFNDDAKFKFLDEAEEMFHFAKGDNEITKREVFSFTTYAEASKDINVRKGRIE